MNNTRVSEYDIAMNLRPDRHCIQPTKKGKMKCMRCFDYNGGVRCGVCKKCGFDRFDADELAPMLLRLDVDDAHRTAAPPMDVCFEARIERSHRWSDETLAAVGANNHCVHRVVKETFAEKAMVHVEGSVRKNTAVRSSDVDLMVTLSHRAEMTEEERQRLAGALRARTDVFKNVVVGKNSIKVTPVCGPQLDVVAHHSAFEGAAPYLQPAGTGFWGRPAAALAVSGLKVWWDSLPASQTVGAWNGATPLTKPVPGRAWEEMVLRLGSDFVRAYASMLSGTKRQRTRVQAGADTGLSRFLAVMQWLAADDHHKAMEGTSVPMMLWLPVHRAAKTAFAAWLRSPRLEAFGI